MLWKEFSKKESCDGCPLLKNEICPGGMVCYGGAPIEPPCCCFEDDTDLDEWVSRYLEQQRAREDREDRLAREEAKKKERAKKSADTRRAIRWYCRDELYALNRAQKALQAQEAAERFVSSFAEAVNFTNKMFRYEEQVQVKPEISAEVKQLRAEVASAKERYDAKRKEFYAKRKAAQQEELQKELERCRGCPACLKQEVIAWDMCNDGIVIQNDGRLHMLSGGSWEAEIKYCPICGRELSAPSAAQNTTTL